MATKKLGLLWVMLLLSLAISGAILRADTATPNYQVKVLTDELVGMDEFLKLGVYGEFGTAITNLFAKDAPSARQAVRLHLNGVIMSNMPPSVQTPQSVAPGTPLAILQFCLVRNSGDNANRGSWDALFRCLPFSGDNTYNIGAGVSLSQGIEHQAEGLLKFSVASTGKLAVVIGLGLTLFVGGIIWAIKSSMLRDGDLSSTYSLGRTQMAFWGLLVALCFLGVWIINGSMERIPPQVLTLLGISASTGLSAIFIGNSKKPAATPPADHESRKSVGFWSDLISDETGPTFSRFQVVLWTIILGVIFVGNVVTSFSMPEFESTLLILMGISNGTYLGFKTQE